MGYGSDTLIAAYLNALKTGQSNKGGEKHQTYFLIDNKFLHLLSKLTVGCAIIIK
jgi:hypothetical protein